MVFLVKRNLAKMKMPLKVVKENKENIMKYGYGASKVEERN